MPKRRSQTKRVHIEGDAWTYQVGGSYVSIKDPNGKRTVVHRSKIVRGHGQGAHAWTDDWFVYPTPAIVKNYIWRKLRPGQLVKEPGDYEQAKDSIMHFFEGDVKQEPERIK